MPVSARGDSKVLVGVDYYPEQWPRARWPIDAKLMADAGVRVVRVGEFAWSEFEPAPGRYAFAWLDDALQLLRQHDISVVLGTPTATPPAWLIQRHPEILPVDPDGVRVGFGGRRHYCPTRAVYRRYAGEIVTSLADHYREHGAVIGWQIDNEFACHRGGCFCEECRTTFQHAPWRSTIPRCVLTSSGLSLTRTQNFRTCRSRFCARAAHATSSRPI